jgi:hypothetical protein
MFTWLSPKAEIAIAMYLLLMRSLNNQRFGGVLVAVRDCCWQTLAMKATFIKPR